MTPELAALVAGASTDHPRKLKSGLRKLASPLPPAERIAFYEQACRALAEVSVEVATWAFTQAWKTGKEEGASDVERLHGVLLELVPAGVVAPTVLRDHAGALSARFPPDEAHARFRAVVCAGFAAGLIPYARIFPDLRRLAAAAGLAKDDEDAFLATRLLRDGLLPGAPPTIWAAAAPALAAVATRDGGLLDLLVAAEPDPPADETRHRWLEILADAGAGARLPPEWFATTGRRCPAATLLRLADQGEGHLFPRAGEPPSGTDPAAVPPTPAPWYEAPDAELRATLRADLESGGLSRLDRGLSWLAEKGSAFLRRDPGFLSGLSIGDPVDTLLAELRTGIPEEIGIRAVPPSHDAGRRRGTRSILQHRAYVTVRNDGEAVASDGRGGAWKLPLGSCPADLMPWYDGTSWYVSRQRPGGRWQTFLVEGPTGDVLTLEPGSRAARPEAPGTGEVTFPGATERNTVRLRDGVITVTAPDGAEILTTAFTPRQAEVPPPAAWDARDAVDPAGSAWLRSLDREAVRRLMAPVLPRSSGVRHIRSGGFVAELLPEITAPALAHAVAERLERAARCLFIEHSLLTGQEPPPRPPLSPLLETVPDLPTRHLRPVVSLRLVCEHLVAAAADGPEPPEPVLLRTFDRFDATDTIGEGVEDVIGLALSWLWPWTPHREWALDDLRARANTPLGDGSGRWRVLWFDRSFGGPDHSHLQLWRTPGGALMTVSGRSLWRDLFVAVEFSPDGRFRPARLPDRAPPVAVVPQSRFSPEFLRRLERLRAENGPPPADAGIARELAGRAGITTANAVGILYGDEHGSVRPALRLRPDEPGLPADVVELLDATRHERETSGTLEWRHLSVSGRRSGHLGRFRERLMPDDPADLWTSGPDIARAADWWRAQREQHGE
ncbi:hypothetical protein GCM10009678_00290 [Actinomadura kijaniata]|uniref:Uncharacterized protein n=1 Tax=Actinomadura namibiensis TaxID=182080 RepID=A0A7W3LSK9_ACTNM|nr:hypothetical protein [Actinomadura namibiensis]MBA8953445.1 hypothetical protein [Actinomadura namibiensis]